MFIKVKTQFVFSSLVSHTLSVIILEKVTSMGTASSSSSLTSHACLSNYLAPYDNPAPEIYTEGMAHILCCVSSNNVFNYVVGGPLVAY